MRSPAGHPAVRQALVFYVYLWFEMERAGLSADLYKTASRAAILSSAASGLTHPESSNSGCKAPRTLGSLPSLQWGKTTIAF